MKMRQQQLEYTESPATQFTPPTIGKKALALFAAGYLLFCHGCHAGDVDDDLVGKLTQCWERSMESVWK
jgi:hypothetical protein